VKWIVKGGIKRIAPARLDGSQRLFKEEMKGFNENSDLYSRIEAPRENGKKTLPLIDQEMNRSEYSH